MPRKKVIKRTRGGVRIYTEADKRAACIEYQISGNVSRTAKGLGMPQKTLSDWRKQEWWAEMMEESRDQAEDRIEVELNQIIELAHARVKDSLTEGDEKVSIQQGKEYRYKVLPTGKEAAVMAGVAYDKRRLTLNLPTSIGSKDGNKKLEVLAEEFRQLSRSFEEKKVNSIDGECEEVDE